MTLTPAPHELDALARRAEEAGLNAAAAPRQAEVDGWLLRLSPGKAKRSRCVNALAGGTLPLDELIARCRRSFDQAGLPLILRLTPFSQPADLDAQLAARGWTSFDAADVMVRPSLDGLRIEGALLPMTALEYAALIGGLRGSSDDEIRGHAERLAQARVPHQAFRMEHDGELLACGQLAVDGDIAGLFDIFTPEAQRGRGHGGRLCAALLSVAHRQGAASAYLQVGADNAPAQALYRRLGFVQAYRYHYRSDDPRAWA